MEEKEGGKCEGIIELGLHFGQTPTFGGQALRTILEATIDWIPLLAFETSQSSSLVSFTAPSSSQKSWDHEVKDVNVKAFNEIAHEFRAYLALRWTSWTRGRTRSRRKRSRFLP